MSNAEALVTQLSLVCLMVFCAATIGYMVSNDRLVFRLAGRIAKLEQRVKELVAKCDACLLYALVKVEK